MMSLSNLRKFFLQPRWSQTAFFTAGREDSFGDFAPPEPILPTDSPEVVQRKLRYIEKLKRRAEKERRYNPEHAKPFNEMPGPINFPMIKSHWIFFPKIGYIDPKSIPNFFGVLQKKFGNVVKVSNKLVLGFAPEHYEALAHYEPTCPIRPGFEALVKYRKDRPHIYKYTGPFTAQGWMWTELRKKSNNYFREPKKIDGHMRHIEEVTDDLIDHMKAARNYKSEIQDVMQLFCKWSIETIGYVALDRRFGCLDRNLSPDSEAAQLIQIVHGTIENLHEMESGLQIYHYYPTKTYRRLVEAQDQFHSKILSFVDECQEHIKAYGPRNEGDRLSMIDTLLTKADMDQEMVIAVISDMFFAGVETTASAITFVLYHLARNPDKQEKLRSIVLKDFPKGVKIEKGGDMVRHKYLNAVVTETFRLNPVTVGTGRVMQEECVIGGYRVPAGVTVAAILAQVGRSPEFYDNTFDFIPERHLSEEERLSAGCTLAPQTDSVAPFGIKRRICLGQKLAEYEIYNLLIKVMQNFKVEYYRGPIDSKNGITVLPNAPVHLVLKDLE